MRHLVNALEVPCCYYDLQLGRYIYLKSSTSKNSSVPNHEHISAKFDSALSFGGHQHTNYFEIARIHSINSIHCVSAIHWFPIMNDANQQQMENLQATPQESIANLEYIDAYFEFPFFFFIFFICNSVKYEIIIIALECSQMNYSLLLLLYVQ